MKEPRNAKFVRAIAATAIFTFFLSVVYIAHVYYLKVNVVFYAAIADVVIAALLGGFVLFFLWYFQSLSNFEKAQLIVIWLLLGYGIAISVPTVIDRSLSFYILEKLQQRGGGIKQNSFEIIFTKEYIKEYHLVEVRLTEQLESGTIIIKDGCVKLTSKGEFIATVGGFFRQNLLAKNRLLMGEYSDDLTDPFRNSIPADNYKCE